MERTYTISEFREYLENKKKKKARTWLLSTLGAITGGIITISALFDYMVDVFGLDETTNMSGKEYLAMLITGFTLWAASQCIASKTSDNLRVIRNLITNAEEGKMPEFIRSDDDIDEQVENRTYEIRARRAEKQMILRQVISSNSTM